MHVVPSRAAQRSSINSFPHAEPLEPRRLLSAGSLDTSFNGGGIYSTRFGGPAATGQAVAVQADGKIVVAGTAVVPLKGDTMFAISRFNPNGTLDATFGKNGPVMVDPLQLAGVQRSNIYTAAAVSIGPGGAIYVGGTEDRVEGAELIATWAMLKLKSNGALDTTWGFGGANYATFGVGDGGFLNSISARSDGSLIVAGSRSEDGIVGKIGPNGFFASGFGSGGFVDITFPPLSPVSFNSVAVQSDGKIVAAGTAGNGIGVVRVTSTGGLDSSFGTGGKTTNVPDPLSGLFYHGRAMAIAPNGDIMVGGDRTDSDDQSEWLLARFKSNGAVDTSYLGGYTFVHFPGLFAQINAVVIQPDGNTLVAGDEGLIAAVSRFKPDGNFDSAFGAGGFTTVQAPTKLNDTFNGIAFGSDGKISVVGTMFGADDFLLVARVQSGITTGNITGTIYNDANANAKRDTSEKGIAGRTVYIDKNKNGKLDAGEPKTTTSSTGAYTFAKLAPGTYRIRQILPAGWRATSPAGGYYDLTVSAGITSGGRDFASTTKAQISGVVFKDANSNHIQDKGEAALSGWVIYLDANNNGKLDSVEQKFTTGADGRFTFIVVAGTYHLREILKAGFKRTTPTSGLYTITVGSAQTFSGDNFGNR